MKFYCVNVHINKLIDKNVLNLEINLRKLLVFIAN